jgi:transcriptional regulator with XRE-family HTH domain
MVATQPRTGGQAVNSDYFAGRLKELREAAGLTQPGLAKRAGLSKQAIAQWEQGLRGPSWANVVALAEALGISVEAFLEPPAKRPPAGRGRPKKKGKKKGS